MAQPMTLRVMEFVPCGLVSMIALVLWQIGCNQQTR